MQFKNECVNGSIGVFMRESFLDKKPGKKTVRRVCLLLLVLLGGMPAYAASPFMPYDDNRTKYQIADAIRTGKKLNSDPFVYLLLIQSVTGKQFASLEDAAQFIESDAVVVALCDPHTFGERGVYGVQDRTKTTLRMRGCNNDRYVLLYNGEPFMFPRCANPIAGIRREETRASSDSCEWVTERGMTNDTVVVGNWAGVVGVDSSVTSTLSYCR